MRGRRALLLIVAGLLAACQQPATPPGTAPAAQAPAGAGDRLWPLPAPGRSLDDVPASSRTVSGTVTLNVVTNPAFQHNAAYRVAALPAGQALVTASTLEENLLSVSGQVLSATTDDGGRFKLANAPTDFPFVVNALLAGGHRLSAIVTAAQTDVTVDERSTAVAETARWQLRTAPLAGQTDAGPTLRGLAAETLQSLTGLSAKFVLLGDLGAEADTSRVSALATGAGTVLRNAYVAAFGAQVSASGTTDADKLSDLWKSVLGVRPLALTRAAGGGSEQEDGAEATGTMLLTPIDAQTTADGDLVFTEADSHTLRVVPKTDRSGWGATPGALKAGRVYTVAGLVNGPRSFDAFDPIYRPFEQASESNPDAAPKVYDATLGPFPLLTPYRLLLEDAGAGKLPTMVFTSPAANRVFLLPGQDISRFGRTFKAGRVYTVAGMGAVATSSAQLGDGGAATQARLEGPTGLDKDSRGNLYVVDAGASAATVHGHLRLVRASDGKIVTLPLTRDGASLAVPGASDVRVTEGADGNFVYLTDTQRHVIWRAALPADLKLLDTAVPTLAVQAVVGTPGKPGVFTTGLPDMLQANAGAPKAMVLLDFPTSVAFDGAGNMLVADAGNGRIRLVEKGAIAGDGKVYTLAGGFVTSYLEGDARLATLPSSTYLNREPSGNVLVTDRLSNVVRRLWTVRGSL